MLIFKTLNDKEHRREVAQRPLLLYRLVLGLNLNRLIDTGQVHILPINHIEEIMNDKCYKT